MFAMRPPAPWFSIGASGARRLDPSGVDESLPLLLSVILPLAEIVTESPARNVMPESVHRWFPITRTVRFCAGAAVDPVVGLPPPAENSCRESMLSRFVSYRPNDAADQCHSSRLIDPLRL